MCELSTQANLGVWREEGKQRCSLLSQVPLETDSSERDMEPGAVQMQDGPSCSVRDPRTSLKQL